MLQDPFFGIGSDVLSPCRIRSSLADGFEPGEQCFATLQTPSDNFLISCGNWENSFQVMSLTDGRMVQSVRHHKDVVSCVAGKNFTLCLCLSYQNLVPLKLSQGILSEIFSN